MRSNGNPVEDAATDIARAVRARRRALGLTQAELADLAGVGLAFLYAIERGKSTARLDKVVAVLAALGLRLGVGGDGAETAP